MQRNPNPRHESSKGDLHETIGNGPKHTDYLLITLFLLFIMIPVGAAVYLNRRRRNLSK